MGQLLKPRKSLLRIAARRALEQRGYKVQEISGPGIVSGARLRAEKDDRALIIAVRTATDRELGLMRDQEGRWKTIPEMGKVVIAAPGVERADLVDVFGFSPDTLVKIFDRHLARLIKKSPEFSLKAPVFLPLDATKPRGQELTLPALKDKADWEQQVPLPKSAEMIRGSSDSFVDRVRAEFADLNGVSIEEVDVEFRIVRSGDR
jgi:hypothetical protein